MSKEQVSKKEKRERERERKEQPKLKTRGSFHFSSPS